MKPIKVLLVDDDEDDFILTQDILKENPRSQDYELSWCSNYSDAINAMLKRRYDIYLVDYRLGKYSGIDLLHEAVQSNCLQPIIILTGKGDLKIDEEALKIGAADYLVKGEIDSFSLERSIRYAIEHHKALEALKASENKFRIIFERSKDPMIITDYDGNIYDANAAAVAFFETSREDLLKRSATTLYAGASERQRFITQMEDKGSVTELEVDFKTVKGEVKTCSISSFLQISQNGTVGHYHTIIHDLTYRKLQEQESTNLEKANAIERISKNLAYEIRNPLSNVNLALDELISSLKGQEEAVLLDIVKSNSRRIAQLVNEFIASTQPIMPDMTTLYVQDFINDLTTHAEALYLLNIHIEQPEEPIKIAADEDKLKTAFYRIIENAAEAMKNTGNQLTIQVEKTGTSVVFRITDTGKGVDRENLHKAFEPFYTTKPQGAGLGLTHAQQIINAHKGQISIQSSEQETTVNIILPLLKS